MFDARPRVKLYIGLGIFLLIILGLFIALPHRGKTKVEVTVAPGDSQITVNGVAKQSGTLYLSPGEYTFVAKKSGFAADKTKVDVKTSPVSVNLLPTPDSEEAITYLKDHPDVQAAREAIGAKKAQAYGVAVRDQTPLISKLPYSDITGPFTIDYGPSTTRKDGVFLLISDSSPRGRVNAFKWIRQQGYDPTDFEIVYTNFANPLAKEPGND